MAVTPGAPGASWWDRLQHIDRRILWHILIIVVAIPTLWPINIPNAVSPMSRSLWETINATPKNKIVLLSSTWSKGTRGENQGQFVAVLHHLMSRRIRFAVSSFTPEGMQVALDRIREVAPRYDYVYGRDWVSLGYQASAGNFVKGINVDLIGTVKLDSVDKKPLGSLPVMAGIRSIDDVNIVVEFSAAATHMVWIQLLKSGVMKGFCPTSVMAPESLPYYASGQLTGVLWGAKGAYDYEQLNVEHGTGPYSFGRQYMGPLSAAFGLVIVSIVVGNLAMFASRARVTRRGM